MMITEMVHSFLSNSPLSLINADMKIYTEELAQWLNEHPRKIIHFDKTDTVERSFSLDNLRLLLDRRSAVSEWNSLL